MRSQTPIRSVVLAFVLLAAPMAAAQTSQPGSAIDIEIYNPSNGDNAFCVAPSELFSPRVYFRPGTGTLSCNLDCAPPSIPGGSANIATSVIDIAFDSVALRYVTGSIQNNSTTAAVQGIAQEQNVDDERVGWALAGTWSTPGNPASTLMSPCDTQMLTTDSWLFQLRFRALQPGMSTIRLRRETDAQPFALSFADICGTEAFKGSNGGVDEVKNLVVLVTDSCSDVFFFDGFETGGPDRWSSTSD